MKKIIDSLKYLHLKDLLSPFIFIFILPFALIFRLFNKIRRKELWLICESGNTARDNGYHFFKYVRENYPNDFCFYVIDKKCSDYKKVEQYRNVIQFRSFKHWIYYLAAKYNISSQKSGNPNQIFFYIIHVVFGWFNNRVFLQHGVILNNCEWLYYKNTKFRLFISGAPDEYNFILKKFGYNEKNLKYTGLARFDNLNDYKCDSKKILIMPSWRQWLGRETNILHHNEEFKKTDYYKAWNSLINNDKLLKYLSKKNIELYFYPHLNMQKFIKKFNSKSDKVHIVDNSNIDIQTLLKECSLMITDYSSVCMDFAYMIKPIIYYQFDSEEYRSKQYSNGYFDYENDGFGETIKQQDLLIKKIIYYIDNNYNIEKKYYDKMANFYSYHDDKNNERIYQAIKGLNYEKN